MVENANTIWADGPSGSPLQPDKAQIRAWGTWIESFISSIGQNSGTVFTSRSDLFGSLGYPQNTMAWVVGDPVASWNGVYRKIGTSGSGAWIRVADLPYPFIVAVNAGAGTANAIQVTVDVPISETNLVWLPIVGTNTASPITVSFNGDTPLTIKTNTGNDPVVGGLIAGMIVLGKKQGSEFRLISDQVSSAIVAEAEAQATAAAASATSAANYATLALNNRLLNTFAGDGSTTVFTLSVDPGSKANTDINVDGALQLKSSYTVSGTTLTFTEPPPGDGVTNNIEVSMGGRVDIGVPGGETVNASKIDGSDVTAIRTKLSVYSKSEVNGLVSATYGIAGKLFGLTGSQNATDANNDMDFSAGEAASAGASPVMMTLASAMTKRSDAAWAVGTGNGAMDTGTKPTSGWLHWYLIMRPDTGVVDICCSASASAPTIGGSIPAAYTKYRRIRSTKTDGSGNLVPDSQLGDEILWKASVPENSGSAISSTTTAAMVTLSGVPTGLRVSALINATFYSTADTNSALLTSPDENDQAVGISAGGSNVGNMQNAGGE